MELCRRLAVLVLLLAPVQALAAAKRSLVVELSPADWRGDALSQTLAADLADDQLAPRAPPGCGGPCSDAALRAAGVELVMRAALDRGAAIDYELRALWPGAPPPVRGRLVLRGLDRTGFAGVLRDQLHRLARTTSDDAAALDQARPAQPAAPPAAGATAQLGGVPGPGGIAVALAIALGVLATPILFGLVRDRRLVARAAALRTLLGVASLGALGLAISAIDPGNGDGVVRAAGGIAWGAFAAVALPVVVPPLVGLARIDYRELGRVLAAWCGLVIQRALLVAAVYAPVALAVWRVGGGAGDGDGPPPVVLILPLALLAWRQWVRLVVAVTAERLDAALVDPAADAAGWQAAVRGYLIGYVRRNGLSIDDDLLDRLIVLPATGDEVCVYGGGATPTRLAIPRKMLELALAPAGRPHDYAAPRVSTLHWTEWNTGLVMATEAGAVIATREQRQPRDPDGDPGEQAREHIGEPPTLAGVIEPTALDPRKRYRPHDDPAWLDWDSGEDYDGTDAGDRDFLFGVLIGALAELQRHGDRLQTLALVLRRGGRFTAPVGRLLERLSDVAGDRHAALQGARHHLVQYLGWLAFQREELLTARAYAPELAAMSRRVLGELAGPVAATARPSPAAARARHRLGQLAGFVEGAPPTRARWRRLAVAGAVLAGAGAAALAVADAVRYHATYPDRPQSTTETREKPDHGKD